MPESVIISCRRYSDDTLRKVSVICDDRENECLQKETFSLLILNDLLFFALLSL
ncbi:hypothetical protein ESCAB7627_1327 [Escherichia albertii TW07627]|uniref:Uncharacterized protein n=1 Tax=Escherichia albertii (strain TW07627) TaxID=502347 RepID=A0ABC9NQC6_ESCAT|nr:hypothetical protein ESCAB7627_1327 [Escherichia albertii TW07627]